MTLLACATLIAVGYAQTARQSPQEGVVLLKHGTTLSGFITPAGDSYVVLLGESGEARVPASDVVAVVSSLQAAYEYKRSRMDDSLAARIDLAQWCLQHNLPARAADQLLAAERLFGRNSQLESIHQRLLAGARLRTLSDETQGQKSSIAKVSFEEELSKLPRNTLDSFNTTVQPLLLNRCASGGCHNMRGTSEFVLFRPFVGQATTRRLTERNLQVTLAYVDRAAPLESLLLSKAAVPHGGAESAAIEAREQKQFDLLTEWVRSLGVQRRAVEPTTIAPANELLYQPGRSPRAESGDAAPETPSARQPKVIAEPVGDPFDPALFNQRHHGRRE